MAVGIVAALPPVEAFAPGSRPVLISCWSVKGGSGTTVAAAALSLLFASNRASGALAVDVAGDLPAALGVAQPPGPGLGDWLEADESVGGAALLTLAAPATDNLSLIGAGRRSTGGLDRWRTAAATLVDDHRAVVVDCGGPTPPTPLLECADHSLLVLRPCYLALRRATQLPGRVTGVVLVSEPGRCLGPRDVESVVGVPVVADIPVEPAVARAVDAGLLSARLPMSLGRALRAVA